MDGLRRLTWKLRATRTRLDDTEQRFYDAYCRGGEFANRRLVVPLDFFARRDVRIVVTSALRGRVPDPAAELQGMLDEPVALPDAPSFRENVATFLDLARDPCACRVTWRGPDGQLLCYGSDIFD